jgi:hypothetical protein
MTPCAPRRAHWGYLRTKALANHMDRAARRYWIQSLKADQTADRICLAHHDAKEVALDQLDVDAICELDDATQLDS